MTGNPRQERETKLQKKSTKQKTKRREKKIEKGFKSSARRRFSNYLEIRTIYIFRTDTTPKKRTFST